MLTEVLESNDIEGFNTIDVLKRNERWIGLLKDLPPSSKRRLIAVGAGHLLDLFEKFKALGYEVKNMSLS